MKMNERELKRNSEGYNDPTAYEALKGMAKEGEIWTYKDKEMLIIKNHGNFCNALALIGTRTSVDDIEVISKTMKYTNPAMVQYVYTDKLGQFVKELSDLDFANMLNCVGAALGIERGCEEQVNTANDDLIRLKVQHKYLQRMYDDLLQKLIEKAVVGRG